MSMNHVSDKRSSSQKFMRLALLIISMAWPWFCAEYGMRGLKDYQLTMLLYGFLCCLLPSFLFRRKKLQLFPVGLTMSLCLILLLLLNAVVMGTFYFTRFGIDPQLFLLHAKLIHMVYSPSMLGAGLYFIIVNPIAEEVFWRGFVYEEWQRFVSKPWAIAISSIGFGSWHWMIIRDFCPFYWSLFLTFGVAIAGVLLALVYEKTQNLTAPILLHSLGMDVPLLLIVLQLLQVL